MGTRDEETQTDWGWQRFGREGREKRGEGREEIRMRRGQGKGSQGRGEERESSERRGRDCRKRGWKEEERG